MADSDELDFSQGIAVDRIPVEGILLGKVGTDDAILVRRGEEFFVVGANCSHYSGPLAKGLVTGTQLRCPLHHACFDLRTGDALRAPALDPIPCWRVELSSNRLFARERLPGRRPATPPSTTTGSAAPSSIVIIGGGAAALSAAHTLRREGYDGRVTMISADEFAPYDRPNLSKDYLAGTAQDDWIPLRSPDYYVEQNISLVLKSTVTSIDFSKRVVYEGNGQTHEFDKLLLATGAEPVKLEIPGAASTQIHYLRSYADSRALAQAAHGASEVVVVGSSFIGLEAAASLRARGLTVHVVSIDRQPLEHIMGPAVGRFLRNLHQSNGVIFHLEDSIARVDGRRAKLKSRTVVDADLLVIGVGVRPNLSLAENAGLKVDHGVVVDEFLETSAPGIFAAGDIARWPDRRSGESMRVEHWVVAERQGNVAAKNMLGRRERFDAVPFFWTSQFGVSLNYVGHAVGWDTVDMDGSLENGSCALRYQKGGRTAALVTLGRDLDSLRFEAQMEGDRAPN